MENQLYTFTAKYVPVRGYEDIRWNRASDIVVIARNRSEALKEMRTVLGSSPERCRWEIEIMDIAYFNECSCSREANAKSIHAPDWERDLL